MKTTFFFFFFEEPKLAHPNCLLKQLITFTKTVELILFFCYRTSLYTSVYHDKCLCYKPQLSFFYSKRAIWQYGFLGDKVFPETSK